MTTFEKVIDPSVGQAILLRAAFALLLLFSFNMMRSPEEAK